MIKIVADSSADMQKLNNTEFCSVPLKIITEEKEYIDDKDLDVSGMVSDLSKLNGKSSTACPSVGDWLEAFGDAEEIFCITITSGLSGCYNSAVIAKREYEEKYPDRKVFVIDSLSTGPEMKLIAEKLEEYILNGESFSDICKKIKLYLNKTGLLFMLRSLKNLANNGRVSKIIAKAVGVLGIRIVGRASDVGELEQLSKNRGEKNGLTALFETMKSLGYNGGKVRLAHCNNENGAKELELIIRDEFSGADIEIYPCRGLCSFYAEEGGILLGFEKE